MTVDSAAIESLVAIVASAAVGAAVAARFAAHPHPPGLAVDRPRLRTAVPALVAALTVFVLGAALARSGGGTAFVEGLAVGGLATLGALWLLPSSPKDGPGPSRSAVPTVESAGAIGAGGLAIFAVLLVVLVLGPDPVGLFGVATAPGLALLLAEPTGRSDGRIRFAGLTASLAVATAAVAEMPILRTLVPNALLLPLAVASVGLAAGAVGVLVDRLGGRFQAGVPSAAGTAVVLTSILSVVWSQGREGVVIAAAAGWFGAAATMYALRFTVYESAEAAESARSGVALGVIGSFARGLRGVGLAAIAVGASLLIAYAAIAEFSSDGRFGILLAAVSATVAAVVLAPLSVGSGPSGTPRRVPAALDTVASTWAALAVLMALGIVLPAVTGVPAPVLDQRLTLGSPSTLAGLVLGAIVPFFLSSAVAPASAGAPPWRRPLVAIAPALVAVAAALLLGSAAVVGLVLGSMGTGLCLGLFWVGAREATASLQVGLPDGSAESRALELAFESGTGWRAAAATLATVLAVLAVVAVVAPTSGVLGG